MLNLLHYGRSLRITTNQNHPKYMHIDMHIKSTCTFIDNVNMRRLEKLNFRTDVFVNHIAFKTSITRWWTHPRVLHKDVYEPDVHRCALCSRIILQQDLMTIVIGISKWVDNFIFDYKLADRRSLRSFYMLFQTDKIARFQRLLATLSVSNGSCDARQVQILSPMDNVILESASYYST